MVHYLLQATNQVLAFVKDSGGHVHAHGWQLVGSASGCTLVDQQVQVDGAHMKMSRQKPAACHHHLACQHPVSYTPAVCFQALPAPAVRACRCAVQHSSVCFVTRRGSCCTCWLSACKHLTSFEALQICMSLTPAPAA